MNPLISVSITLHFEVSNSEMFGGKGSIGYTAVSFDNVTELENVNDNFVFEQIMITAKMLEVTVEDVKLISKLQYDFETEDEGDE